MSDHGRRTAVRTRDALGLLVFAVLWLFPSVYAGLAGRPLAHAPHVLAYLTDISCLFTHAAAYAAYDHIQVLPTKGGSWVTIPDAPFLRMAPFGYRTRLDEYARRDMLDDRALREFALWLRARYSELHPHEPPLAGVRLVAVAEPPSRNVPVGHFRKAPLESFRPGVPRIWFTKVFDDEGPPAPSSASPSSPAR